MRERFCQHRGNADVVRQELSAERGVVVSLRTVERAVAPYRAVVSVVIERSDGAAAQISPRAVGLDAVSRVYPRLGAGQFNSAQDQPEQTVSPRHLLPGPMVQWPRTLELLCTMAPVNKSRDDSAGEERRRGLNRPGLGGAPSPEAISAWAAGVYPPPPAPAVTRDPLYDGGTAVRLRRPSVFSAGAIIQVATQFSGTHQRGDLR